jgi:hypothetical protein
MASAALYPQEIHLIRTRIRDLLACSIVPQPTTLPRASSRIIVLAKKHASSKAPGQHVTVGQCYFEADSVDVTVGQC